MDLLRRIGYRGPPTNRILKALLPRNHPRAQRGELGIVLSTRSMEFVGDGYLKSVVVDLVKKRHAKIDLSPQGMHDACVRLSTNQYHNTIAVRYGVRAVQKRLNVDPAVTLRLQDPGDAWEALACALKEDSPDAPNVLATVVERVYEWSL